MRINHKILIELWIYWWLETPSTRDWVRVVGYSLIQTVLRLHGPGVPLINILKKVSRHVISFQGIANTKKVTRTFLHSWVFRKFVKILMQFFFLWYDMIIFFLLCLLMICFKQKVIFTDISNYEKRDLVLDIGASWNL